MSSSGALEQRQRVGRLDQVRPGARRAHAGGQDRRQVERAQRQPQRGGGRAGARALEADLAEVQVAGGEVGVRRVVLVQPADAGVAEQHRAAAVGLQAVLVRVDDDAVGAARSPGTTSDTSPSRASSVKNPPYAASTCTRTPKRSRSATARAMSSTVPGPGRPGGHDDHPDVAGRAQLLDDVQVDPAVRVRRHRERLDARAPRTCARACSARSRRGRRPCPDAARARPTAPRGSRSCPMTSGGRASRPGSPNISASHAITSSSIALVAGPPSSAWLFALTCIAAV